MNGHDALVDLAPGAPEHGGADGPLPHAARTPLAEPPLAADIAALVAAPYRYNLFQAISLLERAAARENQRTVSLGTGDGRGEGVRFHAHIAMQFPGADIRKVEAATYTSHRGAPYVLSTAVMSLAGSQAPLPYPFTEMILQRTAVRDHATAAFLDIFHHRFLSFLYRSRKKHAPSLDRAPLSDAPVLRSIAALANLGDLSQVGKRDDVSPDADLRAAPGDERDVPGAMPRPWLQHAGLLGAGPRSMTGLLALLGDRLKVTFTGRQFVGAWQALDHAAPPTLGGNAGQAPGQDAVLRLDGQCALGQRFWDQSAAFELRCTLEDRTTYDSFLPGGEAHALIVWLVRRYLQAPTDVHLVLRLVPRTPQPARLSVTTPMRLGWSSWLAQSAQCAPTLPPARVMLRDRHAA